MATVMRLELRAAILSLCCALAGCDSQYARALPAEIEKDLGVHFSEPPRLVAHESYGWAEEGGERVLLQLSTADCLAIGALLPEDNVPVSGSEAIRMFNAAGLAPKEVRRKWDMNAQGDTREYELDQASCVLFREAHSE